MPSNADNRYGSLSAWGYDLDKPIGHSFGDVEFLLGRLAGCGGPVLEPAVGFAAPVISGGFEHGRPPRSGDIVISFEAERR